MEGRIKYTIQKIMNSLNDGDRELIRKSKETVVFNLINQYFKAVKNFSEAWDKKNEDNKIRLISRLNSIDGLCQGVSKS